MIQVPGSSPGWHSVSRSFPITSRNDNPWLLMLILPNEQIPPAERRIQSPSAQRSPPGETSSRGIASRDRRRDLGVPGERCRGLGSAPAGLDSPTSCPRGSAGMPGRRAGPRGEAPGVTLHPGREGSTQRFLDGRGGKERGKSGRKKNKSESFIRRGPGPAPERMRRGGAAQPALGAERSERGGASPVWTAPSWEMRGEPRNTQKRRITLNPGRWSSSAL
ncbi:collagen alpha-2(VI) chain-like [Pseudopipra pipra]|uniref:collagen alpha-2(VI) chain-like n=1 Tax=Pseudopipra pipra TaxID=415032 RepID=UPI0031398743